MHEPVEVLVVDLFFIGAAVVAISWVKRRWVRVVSIVAALAAGTAFVLLRDRYDLEDSAFLWTLFLFCIVAAAITTATCIGLRRDVRTSAAYGAVAAAGVPLVFGASLALRYSLCLITHCDQS